MAMDMESGFLPVRNDLILLPHPRAEIESQAPTASSSHHSNPQYNKYLFRTGSITSTHSGLAELPAGNIFDTSRTTHETPPSTTYRTTSTDLPTTRFVRCCTDLNCFLPSPPLTGSEYERTIPLPHVHGHVSFAPHVDLEHIAQIPTMHNGLPPSPPLTVPLPTQELPEPRGEGSSQPHDDAREWGLALTAAPSMKMVAPPTPDWDSEEFGTPWQSLSAAPPIDDRMDASFTRAHSSVIGKRSRSDSSTEPNHDQTASSSSVRPVSLPLPDDCCEVSAGPKRAFPSWLDDVEMRDEESLSRPPDSPRSPARGLPELATMDIDTDHVPPDPSLATCHDGLSALYRNDACMFESATERGSFVGSTPFLHASPLNYCSDLDGERLNNSSLFSPPIPSSPRSAMLDLSTDDAPLSPAPSEDSRLFGSFESGSLFDASPPPDSLTPSSPSRRSFTSLPPLDDGEEGLLLSSTISLASDDSADALFPSSPRHSLLSLPGAEPDDELLPTLPLCDEPSHQSGLLLSSLLGDTNQPEDTISDSDDIVIPLQLQDHVEVIQLHDLRRRTVAAEKAAGEAEDGHAEAVKGIASELVASECNSTEEDRVALRLQFKRAKECRSAARKMRWKAEERKRECSALLRHLLADRTMERSAEADALGITGKNREPSRALYKLVASMFLKRHESYRPIVNRSFTSAIATPRTRTRLSQSSTSVVNTLDSEEELPSCDTDFTPMILDS